jgi:FMN-dependent NADH-azoreductase
MTTILHIDSSAKAQDSPTHALTAGAIAALLKKHPQAKVIHRDLTKDPLNHISPEFLAGIFAGGEYANHATVKLSDKLVDELLSADILVIGAPMYNFGIPSQLKAWIDYVVRAGKTFRYSEKGPEGLVVTGKRAIIAIGSGGVYSEGPMAAFDHVGPYLKQVLGFIGISDVAIVRAERLAFGPEAVKQAMEDAGKKINELAA